MEKLVRVNTRLGVKHNEFLDKESAETGISKSALIQLAVDQYMLQRQTITSLGQIMSKMDEIEQAVKK